MHELMRNVDLGMREALLVKYSSLIGVGSVFYVELRYLYPKVNAAGSYEEESLLCAIGGCRVLLFHLWVVVSGLSISALEIIYREQGAEMEVEMGGSGISRNEFVRVHGPARELGISLEALLALRRTVSIC